ncbi:unnamed protein product [Arabidopsis lyrata]|nr:unnamed protein product [Arabidopsis lyrata]
MTMMYDISQDLLEEILSRVPVTSLRAVRSTCKRWNDIIKDPSFSKKYGGKGANEFLVIMLNDFRACLMSVNLHGILDNKDLKSSLQCYLKVSSLTRKRKLVAVIRSVHGENSTNNTAYMIGEDGYCKEVDLGESKFCPSMWSYVPSCVQIQ